MSLPEALGAGESLSMRLPCVVSTISLLWLPACFNPEEGGDTDDGTETSTGDASTTATTPGTATTLTGTGTPTTDDTGDTSDPDSTGQNCQDQCSEVGAACDGDTLITCAEGEDGCLEETTEECASGCMNGACVETTCGDGVIDDGEDCDDENTVAGDGCEDDCSVTPGWECSGAPSTCVAPNLVAVITNVENTGANITVQYRVWNYGGLTSGPFDVGIWPAMMNLDMPPTMGAMPPIVEANIPSLDPGESIDLQEITPSANGDLVAYVLLDPSNDVVETDENDNIALGYQHNNVFNVVRTSFPSLDQPVVVPDDGTPVEMSVVALPGVSAPEIYFSVNVSHEAVEELEVTVLGPGGGAPQRLLFADGNAGANLQSTTFRDGGMPIAMGDPPYIGVWNPAGAWVGGMPDNTGEFTVEIRDAVPGGNDGSLNAFTVHYFEFDP